MNFQEKAIKAVAMSHGMMPQELYVVWFCKTLQNWKALVSTDTFDGTYWEVTYNGGKQETYVDRYTKALNLVIQDSVFED